MPHNEVMQFNANEQQQILTNHNSRSRTNISLDQPLCHKLTPFTHPTAPTGTQQLLSSWV